jgi:transposase
VKTFLEKSGIMCLFNIPYCPQYNGIELLWSDLKRKFRRRLTELKIKEDEIDVEKILHEIQDDYPDDKAKNFARRGRNKIAGK